MTSEKQHKESNIPERRDFLKNAILGGIGVSGILGASSMINQEERILLAKLQQNDSPEDLVDGVSGATRQFTNWAKLEDLKKKPTSIRIGKKLRVSRMLLGGNLFAGWAHSRDLIYISELIRAYNTPEKLLATFQLAEACGINTFLSHFSHYAFIEKYWEQGGNMNFFADCRSAEENAVSMDKGAAACYINGEKNDEHVANGRFDIIEAHLEQVRKRGVVAGLGAHRLITVQKIMERGIIPDFWMKTFHHTDYWSAKHPEEHDNIFCREPIETAEYMKEIDIPWIAFKVLAAGAITPDVGFRYAFEGGADAICVGMYDFQTVDNVNTLVDILDAKDTLQRSRRWI